MDANKPLSEKESLAIITQMITRAKESYHDTGIGAIMWGCVIAICSLEKLAENHFNYKLPFDIYLLTLFAIIPQIFITIREKKERKVKTQDDVFMDYLWLGFGISIFLLSHIIGNISINYSPMVTEYKQLGGTAPIFKLYEYTNAFLLMLYGLPTFVTGFSFRFKPMLWGGIYCWLCSILTVYTSIKIDLLLVATAAIFAWLIPGIVMEKEYRQYKKQQALTNV